jgi:hypothetical protein
MAAHLAKVTVRGLLRPVSFGFLTTVTVKIAASGI